MAANRIKGITVEIGGDTTKLQTALKGVNTEIRNTQSQLKDVEKLLKLDPGNTELMAQKHRLLGDAVRETKEKLETLKTAAEQANTALANGEISQSQYDALQREIIETENNLRDLERQAGQSAVALQKIAATGEKLKTVGSAIEGVGRKLMPITASVGGLGAAAVKVASDFDSAMSQVAAVSGATGKDLEALRDKAREMGSKTKFSASEAAEAMNYMAMAGWKTNDMLSGIEGIMNLAAASGAVGGGFRAFRGYPRGGKLECEYERIHDGGDVQILCACRWCARLFRRGYRRSYRPDGERGHQVLPGRHGHALHDDEPHRGSEVCRGRLRGADHPDHEHGRQHEEPRGHPGRLPRGICADVRVGEGSQCGGSGGEERHVRLPCGDERRAGGH